jgi:hypothetical protein
MADRAAAKKIVRPDEGEGRAWIQNETKVFLSLVTSIPVSTVLEKH